MPGVWLSALKTDKFKSDCLSCLDIFMEISVYLIIFHSISCTNHYKVYSGIFYLLPVYVPLMP